ncbi:polyhydroxyalkanoate synthesis repressor PhaR [Roseateles aquatilis]|uniref:Polyhydroxyalkanoate synthesis repressor PhaR n=1 Tax=Roseateles aquatilis TaxID=431061 RepID=A0A246JG38_9BURK|nr:polyhydroxyalkanoate synthesis repressor PhaR [Roseateles aquatilis]OWQ91510.1 polyhydroxyalkanoate synthesis repressor PhaR [Roseateles aquatilis]
MVTARRGKTAPGSEDPSSPKGLRVLKKYPNRRLYDTQTSSYITLADVKKMVLEGAEFEVRDAKSGDELTRSILLQIILEEEMGGMPMFSTPLLSQIIRFYGHAMQGLMGAYLEKNLQAFTEMQARFAEQSKGGSFNPELWSQFMSGQAPMMQGLMGNYLEQSKNLFLQMQEQFQNAGNIFPGVPGFPPQPPKK